MECINFVKKIDADKQSIIFLKMSFRIEEKLLITNLQIFQFKEYLFKNNAKILFPEREISSLYFDNSTADMYKDSVEGTTPEKKFE